ncbi:NAD kinase [Bacteroidia bacterium]|nr:NAD kinase [Bacteroidia bacterium]
MKIAIYSRTGNVKQEQGLLQLVAALRSKTDILLYEPIYQQIAKKYNLQIQPSELFRTAADLTSDVLCMISVGGDGTMLDAAALSINTCIPIVGLSTGRLGFLPILEWDTLNTAIENILHKNFEVEQRDLLLIQGLQEDNMMAINDICIQKRGSAIAEINVHINHEFLSTYWADGLIISTPTGSTAYSLSAGGPIVSPQAACFVVVPIAPHNLNMRPIVVPNSAVLSINMRTRSGKIVVGIDSKEYEIPASTQLTVKKAAQQVGFIKLPHTNFYQILREKLLWGVDTRK